MVPSCLSVDATESPGGTNYGVLLTPSDRGRSRRRNAPSSEDIMDKHLVMSIDLRAEGADASDSWLTGVFIDYIFQRFAHRYEDTVFLPTSFAAVQLPQLYRASRKASVAAAAAAAAAQKNGDANDHSAGSAAISATATAAQRQSQVSSSCVRGCVTVGHLHVHSYVGVAVCCGVHHPRRRRCW